MFGLFGGGPKMPVNDVKTAIESGAAVLVDVRDPSEVRASGVAEGAINVPLTTLQMKANPSSPECLPAFKEGKTVVVYCASGARSAGAAQMLRQMGHQSVENLGGLRDWAMGGGAVVPAA
ncbi:rhodanese-like domain-containing protein [Celeribacter sp.]|uniref:rhodanese-like domain-containing protein n=1 Tax=Celeribacter sp. TaxID=1890673 RepID=UPI003A904337